MPAEVVEAIRATGLLPHPDHELVRNILVSPLTGLHGGRADLRPVTAELDERICATPSLAKLPGRFLLVLDDGRGDLVDRSCDLGLVALDAETVQLRIGSTHWGPVVPLHEAAARLTGLARAFQQVRDTAWHVDELPRPARLARRRPAPARGEHPTGVRRSWRRASPTSRSPTASSTAHPSTTSASTSSSPRGSRCSPTSRSSSRPPTAG